MRASPFALAIKGVPFVHQPQHGMIRTFINHLIISYYSNAPVDTSTEGAILGTHIRTYLPFKLPPLAFSYTGGTDVEMDDIINDGFYKTVINDVELYLKQDPTMDDFRKYNADNKANDKIRTPRGVANLQAIYAGITMNKILSGFVACWDYSTLTETPADLDAYRRDPPIGTKRSAATFTDDKAWVPSKLAKTGRSQSMRTTYNTMTGLTATTDMNEILAANAIVDARGQSLRYLNNSDGADIQYPGILLPYFSGLGDDDEGQRAMIFFANFLPCMGPTMAKQLEVYQALKTGWGVLNSTTFGYELAHIMKVISLAMECGSRVVPIFSDGLYEGAILRGAGFGMIDQNTTTGISSPAALRVEYTSRVSHSVILDKIAAEIGLVDKTGFSSPVVSMKQLHEQILLNPTNAAKLTTIRELGYLLRFPQSSWSPSLPNLVNALEMVAGSKDIPDDAPLSPEVLGQTDRVTVILSCFGRSVPSFDMGSGHPLDLRKTMPAPSPVTVGAARGRATMSQKNLLDSIMNVRFVTLPTAVADLKRIMTSGIFRVQLSNRKGKNSVKVVKRAERGALWTALARVVQAAPSTTRGAGPAPTTAPAPGAASAGIPTSRNVAGDV